MLVLLIDIHLQTQHGFPFMDFAFKMEIKLYLIEIEDKSRFPPSSYAYKTFLGRACAHSNLPLNPL